MSAIDVVEHLRNLASDPKNRGTIVKDQSCLAGLVLFLDNADERVVIKALEALRFLSEHPPNRSSMMTEMGMTISLKTIMNKDGYNKNAKLLAREVYYSITHPNTTTANGVPRNRARAPSSSFFLGPLNKKAKSVVLHIKGLTSQITRKLCEQELLRVKGVISFTFDMSKSRCTIRCRTELAAEELCTAVNKTKVLTAEQVVRNECGEEVMLSFGTNPACSSQGNSSSLPDYLPEEDEPAVFISDKAVAKQGNKENENGWFTSVTSFLSNNLYW